MNFEHALEAMRHGNKVRRKDCPDTLYFIDNGFIKVFDRATEESIIVDLFSYATVLADDWEIYEEPQKGHEMAAEHSIEVLETIRRACKLIPDVDEVIDFAIKTLENQNQQVLVFDPENLSQKELEKVQEKLKECKFEVKPEKKCECECKCNHTVEDADLQEKMKQVLSRKFFEIEKYSDDESTVNSMLNIYNSIFSD